MNRTHPIILSFCDTARGQFPLILVIGREPNADQAVTNEIGRYDFRCSPRCAFWNTSYSMLARVVGSTTRGLKHRCIEHCGSPIIYADALPHCIRNDVVNKHASRLKISETEVKEHVANVFSHRQLINRVQLVVMSGLDDAVFRSARDAIGRRCEREHICAIHVPFFYGTNTTKIQAALTDDTSVKLKSIYNDFLESR